MFEEGNIGRAVIGDDSPEVVQTLRAYFLQSSANNPPVFPFTQEKQIICIHVRPNSDLYVWLGGRVVMSTENIV